MTLKYFLHGTCMFNWTSSETTIHVSSVFRPPVLYYLNNEKFYITKGLFFSYRGKVFKVSSTENEKISYITHKGV